MAGKPEAAQPIGITDMSGDPIAQAASMVWLGNQITGHEQTDDDASEALKAFGVADTLDNIRKVHDIVEQRK